MSILPGSAVVLLVCFRRGPMKIACSLSLNFSNNARLAHVEIQPKNVNVKKLSYKRTIHNPDKKKQKKGVFKEMLDLLQLESDNSPKMSRDNPSNDQLESQEEGRMKPR